MKRTLILLALVFILVIAFLVVPVAADLTITDGEKITTTDGATIPGITIIGPEIAQDGTITINVSGLNAYLASGTLTNANVEVMSDAAATWTGTVAGDTLTLTSTEYSTVEGETVYVTFTGAAGNPWISYTAGEKTIPLTANRTDGNGERTINFVIQTGGLTVANGAKITATDGATSPVITVTNATIEKDGTITIDVSSLNYLVATYPFTTANVVINDTATAATWTGDLAGNILTLTSTEGSTAPNETVNVTFTGAANPWMRDTGGDQTSSLTATRTDGLGVGYFSLEIETVPVDLIIADGAKLTTTDGATSPVITITGSHIIQNDTITIDVSGLNAYVASGTLTDANVMINDTAVAANWTGAVAGDPLTLTLTSYGGPTAVGETVTVTFTGAAGNPWKANTGGNKTASLTATRTDGAGGGTFNFVIETAPPPSLLVVANFSASPTLDIAPLTTTFTDTSLGSPTAWNWSFGDGNYSTSRNPVHTYTNIGTYTVSLNATNAYGSDTKTQSDYISVLNGAVREANTLITGLTITNCGGPQSITVDPSILPAALIPNNSVLEIQPPADSGFNNITIYALNGIGFSRNGPLIVGNPTGVHLVTEEIAPSAGFSNEIGTNSSFNYSIDLPSYPCNAILSTKIWEGVIPEYDAKFRWIASNNSAFPLGTAYTAKVSKTNFPSNARVKLHMSVNSIKFNAFLGDPTGLIFIWRISDNETSGQILPTTYLYSDPVDNLDYFEADSPSGLSTFGLSSLTGNNNPFQVISFVIAEVVNPNTGGGQSSSGTGGGGSSGGVQPTIAPATKSAVAPDSGKTAKIYSNAQGVISQATTLKSTDGLANVSISPGIVARNSSGNPLSSISIMRIPAENLPAGSPGAGLSFTGMAYDLQPDEATFYPSITLSFTIPQAQWSGEYVMQEYNYETGTWQDLPGSYNPQTGIITAQVSRFCCFALFTKSEVIEKTPSPTHTMIVASKSSISTDVEMYSWIIYLVKQNPVIIVIVLAVLALVAYFGWWKRRL